MKINKIIYRRIYYVTLFIRRSFINIDYYEFHFMILLTIKVYYHLYDMFKQQVVLNYEKEKELLFVSRDIKTLSLDTYFNSLNLYLVKKYIEGKILNINIKYKGKAHLNLIYKNENDEMILINQELNTDKYQIDLNDIPSVGIIYPRFNKLDNFELESLEYQIDVPSRKINPAIIFCTYHREQYLYENLKRLEACKGYISHIFVVDNGESVKLDGSFSLDYITVIPNKNLGGSGGFTRGMMESKKNGYSHIILMDDDISLIPEVINNAVNLMSSVSESHQKDWLGFSMLSKNRPLMQYELGTYWNGVRMRINNKNLYLGDVSNILANQVINHYNYSAWWTLFMPTSVMDDYGYPFPFFIKFDDIEYALRRKKEEIILTNGFGVWHQDFSNKLHPSLEYYLYRNALVTNALHDAHPMYHSILRYIGKKIKFYFRGRAIEMRMMDIGLKDYLKGPEYFLHLDIAKRNNEIRGLANQKRSRILAIFTEPFIIIYYSFLLMIKFKKTAKMYKKSFKSLTSTEYWEGVFNHE